MSWLFGRKIQVPVDNDVREQIVANAFEVRWYKMKECGLGIKHPNHEEQLEVFKSAEEAEYFADALRAAFKLLRYSGSQITSVRVREL